MDEPCDTCGDIGVVDAIITCSECRIGREHLYCMQIYREDVSTGWHCNACELSKETVSAQAGVIEPFPKSSMSNSSDIVHHDTTPCPKRFLNNSKRSFINWEKKVETGKVKYIPAQEAIMLSSGFKKFEDPPKINLGSSPWSSKTMASMSVRTPIKPKAISPRFSSQKVRANPTFGASGLLKPRGPGNAQINPVVQKQVIQSSKGIKGKNVVLDPMKEHIHKGQLLDALKPAEEIETTNRKVEMAMNKVSCASSLSMDCPPIIISGDNFRTNVEPRNFDAENTNIMNALPEVQKFFLSDPALHASWKPATWTTSAKYLFIIFYLSFLMAPFSAVDIMFGKSHIIQLCHEK